MITYKDLDNKIHSLESRDFENLLPEGSVEITQAEADAILAPTAEQQLATARANLKSVREAALQAIVHDFGDGRVMQGRPQDAGNINMAIAIGVDTEWVMQDNSVALVTVAELQTALDDGIAQGKAIWGQYMADLKEL